MYGHLESFRPPEIEADPFVRQREVFREHGAGAEIEPVGLESVPAAALKVLEDKSRYLVHPDNYRPGNFDRAYVIRRPDGVVTYVAKQTKQYGEQGDKEELTYLADVDETGVAVGEGEIRWNLTNHNEYFQDKPFVGGTKTIEGKKRAGLGTQRLRLMNAITHMLYALPLHSDTLVSPDARIVWGKLVEKGEARTYRQGEGERFAFVEKRGNGETGK